MFNKVGQWFIHSTHSIFDFLLPPSKEEQHIRNLTLVDVPMTPHALMHGALPITALWRYTTPSVRAIIWALKYRKSRRATELCAEALGEYLHDITAEAALMQEQRPLILIPIPLASKRYKERGFNQISLVLDVLHRDMPHITVEKNMLLRIRETPPQTSLKRHARLKNVQGAFSISKENLAQLSGAHVIIVDDVTTTGSTLREAAKIFQKAKIKVECLALASAGE